MLFYADENLPLDVVTELRRLGHDVLTAFEDGRANRRLPDEEVLTRATELKRIVLTLNRRDFRLLHQQSQVAHAGIIICTQDSDFTRQAERIHKTCNSLPHMDNQLLRIYRPSASSTTKS